MQAGGASPRPTDSGAASTVSLRLLWVADSATAAGRMWGGTAEGNVTGQRDDTEMAAT